jgi:hypothetical protein
LGGLRVRGRGRGRDDAAAAVDADDGASSGNVGRAFAATAGWSDPGLALAAEEADAGWRLSPRVKLVRRSARRDSEVVRSRSKKLAVSSAPRRV